MAIDHSTFLSMIAFGLVFAILGANARPGKSHNHHEIPSTCGDPHFSGADGSYFDFSGVPNTTYCLLSDSHLNVNAYFGGYYGQYEGRKKAITWMREVGIQWGPHSIVLRARQGAESAYLNGYLESIQVDGQAVTLSNKGDSATVANGKVDISWLAAKEKNGEDEIDIYSVDIPGVMLLIMELRPEMPHFRTTADGTVHFDLYFPLVSVSDNIHGILGQTYRSDHSRRLSDMELEYNRELGKYVVPGDNGDGFLDYTVSHYRASSITAADSAVNRFVGLSELDREVSLAMEMTAAVPSVLGSAASLTMADSSTTLKQLRRLRLLKKF